MHHLSFRNYCDTSYFRGDLASVEAGFRRSYLLGASRRGCKQRGCLGQYCCARLDPRAGELGSYARRRCTNDRSLLNDERADFLMLLANVDVNRAHLTVR
jgi:hypothetical protein